MVDDWKPRLVIQCECSNTECGCGNIDTKPEPTETPTNAPTQPTGPPPPSKCKSDNGYQCLTKEEVEFYFSLDEALDGGDPCFDTPLTGTKVRYSIKGFLSKVPITCTNFVPFQRCIIRKEGWFTNWSWDTCTCKPECGCNKA